MGALFSKKTTRQKQLSSELEATYRKLHKQTGTSPSDLKEWHYVFKKQYPRGISQAQFIRENMEAHGGEEELWATVFQGLDTHNEGSIGFVQYITHLHRKRTAPVERKLKEIFRALDRDGDGLVTEEELASSLAIYYKMIETKRMLAAGYVAEHLSETEAEDPSFRAKTIIARFDYDADGALNENEFVDAARSDQIVTEALAVMRDLT